jgi:hypothetical protein
MISPNAVTISTASREMRRSNSLRTAWPLKLMSVQCISRAPSPPHRGRELRPRRPASCRIFVQSPRSSGASCASRRSHGKTRKQRQRHTATTTTRESISIFQYSGNPDSYPRKPQPACANPPKPAALAAGCNAEHWPRAALGAKRTAAAAARPTGFP